MATGMLPICLGEGTKFCQYLLDADKCYEVTGRFGITTNTGDAMGDVITQTEGFALSEAQIKDVLMRFSGKITQVPPMFSALKHKGVPLYKFARAGVDIPRSAREVLIRDITLNQFDGQYISLTVTCSKGTYIRTLIEDIGATLLVGAHVTQLHRKYTAGFATEPMFSLDDLASKTPDELRACLLPMERAVQHLPKMSLDADAIRSLRQGKTILDTAGDIIGPVCLYENQLFFVGIGVRDVAGELKVKRLLTESASH